MNREPLHLLPAPEGGREDMAPYRLYTRALLRRYMRLAVDLGRLPSVLGGLCFRPRISAYRVHTFEDAVIFVHDVEHAFERVGRRHMEIIAGVVLLDYSLPEAALRMGIPVQRAERHFYAALDELTSVLLQGGLLHPLCNSPAGEDDLFDEDDEPAPRPRKISSATAPAAASGGSANEPALPPRIPPAAAPAPSGPRNWQGLRNAPGVLRLSGRDR